MSLPEIFGLISIILLVFVSTLALIILFRKPSDGVQSDFRSVTEPIGKQVDELKDNLTKTMYESMMDFNDKINKQMVDSTDKSAQNITEFRLNVNNELTKFQEKINAKLSSDFKSLTDEINQKMGAINEKVEDRLSKGFRDTNETFLQIAKRVEVIDEAQKKIESLSTEMVSLQNILANNQARGSFGEYQLNQLLYSVFGDNNRLYQTQYTIREGKGKREAVRADAVVFMPRPIQMIAIDSKFPFSSYSKLFDNKELTKEEEEKLIQSFGQEVKKHITDIAHKYIVTGKTAEYALMFVASDGILALLHSKCPSIIEYAREKAVTIVSPTTLIPLLSSFRTITIDVERSKYAQKINEQLQLLSKDFRLFSNEWGKLNSNIDSLKKSGDKVNYRVQQITTKFDSIEQVELTDSEPKTPVLEIETEEDSLDVDQD
ncbi:MAG: DNA recombination protein RmuC [Acholeplasmataceae bacterium]|nr:DNA recombination protein RmuC [Candidatus Izemoplasmatales bacterium]NLF48944.1 DNA recombination protein RmuC [Acholeplasmataceae bacterium]